MRANRLADPCYAAALVTLPWIGLGLVHAATGRDMGAGLQPAYLLLAVAWLLRGASWLGPAGRSDLREMLARPLARRLVVAGLLVLAVLLLSGLGLWIAPAPGSEGAAWPRFWRQVIQVGVMAAFVAYPALWTRGPARWHGSLVWLAAGLAVQVAYAAVQGWHHGHPLAWFAGLERLFTSNPAILAGSEELYLGGHFRGVPRLRGTVCEPLYLGSYLILAVPWTALLARRCRLAGALAVAGAALLVLTWSRGAVLGGLVAVGLWVAVARHARLPSRLAPLVWTLAVALGAGAVIAALVAGPDALLWPVRRLAQSWDRQDWSNLTRLYSMQAGWRAFLASPVFGIGWGQFAFHFPLLVDPLGLQSQFTWPVVNNLPLKILCETGLVGFATMAGLSGWLLRESWRGLAHPDPQRRRRVAVAVAVGGGTLVQLLTFSQYNLPHLGVGLGLWLAAVAAAAPGKRSR